MYKFHIINFVSIILVIQVILIAGLKPQVIQSTFQSAADYRRVNVPELTGDPFTPAIFWFGKVDQTNNYTDVRVWYYDPDYIEIVLHIIDRQLWYDPTPTVSELSKWDSVSIYLNLDGNIGSSPGTNSYLFELQLFNNLQASYRGNGSSWMPAEIPITSYTEWRGASGSNSGSDSEGWVAYYKIPFSSLGLTAAPSQGTVWGLGITLHDRDNLDDSIFQETNWPETIAPNVPSTWGQLSFGFAC